MGNRKFKTKDKITVIDPKNKLCGEKGVITGYDEYSYLYSVKLEKTPGQLGFRARQLQAYNDAPLQVGEAVVFPRENSTEGMPVEGSPRIRGIVFNPGDTLITVQADEDEVPHTWGRGHNGSLRLWSIQKEFVIRASEAALQPKTIDFNSVVIADHKRRQILEALEQIHQQDLIFNVWGFGKTIEKGRGVSMLFYGPPGTGKTLMAQAISEKLNCDLKVITTTEIESSEPGQAERNIGDIFKNAKGKKTVLLFDECDSLIFDRTNLGPILGAQVNALLSNLEKFDGVTIFTTNRVETLDEAVNRRLALKLAFEMPSQDERTEIWKRMFPPECPLGKDIKFDRLAQVEIAGGHIKNSVLRAARIAAMDDLPNEKKKIHMRHLMRALSEEGKSMLDFHEAKKKFNVAGYAGGGMHQSASNSLSVSKMSDMVARLSEGGAYDDSED